MIYNFGSFRLDTDRQELLRAGVAVVVEPKAFSVLCLLIQNSDRIVTKRELREEIWRDEVLSEGVLTRSIWAARKAVDDDGNRQQIIRTVHRRGYRFVAPLISEAPARAERDASPVPGTQGPEGPHAFVGRRTELAVLDEWFDKAATGQPRVVLVRGEAGVGKTRLLQEFGVLASRRGAVVLEGRVPQDTGVPPYWPWRELLRATFESRERTDLLSKVGDALPALSEVFPELRTRFSGATRSGDRETPSRLEIYTGVARLIERLSESQPHLLLLEDVHWADPSSLMLLRFLQGGLGRARALVVAAFRTFDLHGEDPRAALHRSIEAHPECEVLELGGLALEDAGRLAEIVARRSLSVAWARELFRRSDGIALALIELVRFHDSRGELGREPGATRADVSEVLAMLDRRLDRLTVPCLDVLARAAAFGRSFRVDLLEHISPESEESLLRSLAEAESAHIIGALPELGGYQFRHALVRDAVYARATTAERLGLHRQIGHLLERMYAGSERAPYAELVHHLGQSPFHDDQEKVVRFARLAAAAAARIHSYAEAVAHYRHALHAQTRVVPQDLRGRAELLGQLSVVAIGAGDHAAATDALEQALGLARELGDRELFAETVFSLSRIQGIRWTSDDETVARLDEALAVARGRLRAELLVQRTDAAISRGEPNQGALGAEALELARRLADTGLIMRALVMRHQVLWSPYTLDDRVAISHEMLELGQHASSMTDSPTLVDRAWGLIRYGVDLLEMGDLPKLGSVLEQVASCVQGSEDDLPPEVRAEQILERNQLDIIAQGVRLTENTLRILRGEFAQAEAQASALGADAIELGNGDALIGAQVQMFVLRQLQGRADEVVPLMQQLLDQNPGYSQAARAAVVLALADLGREEEARRELEILLRTGFPEDMFLLSSLSLVAEATFLLEIAERSREHYALLQPFFDRNAMSATAYCMGSVSRALGMLATVVDEFDLAEGHFEFALQRNEQLGARPFIASTRQAYAQMLARRKGPGDLARCRTLAASAADEARSLGMPHLEQRASRLVT